MNYRRGRRGPNSKVSSIVVLFLLVVSLLGTGAEKLGFIELPHGFDIFSTETSYNLEAESADIQALIESVEIAEPNWETEYQRDEYEQPVRKFDGESIRNYTLSISENNISKNNKDFEYIDPYTEEVITDVSEIDYDHIIPISYVHHQIGYKWDDAKKNEYAFDIEVGVNTHRSENRGKGSKGPSEYMPETNQEEYAYSWLVIAEKYDIPLRPEDMAVIKRVLNKTKSVSVINEYK